MCAEAGTQGLTLCPEPQPAPSGGSEEPSLPQSTRGFCFYKPQLLLGDLQRSQPAAAPQMTQSSFLCFPSFTYFSSWADGRLWPARIQPGRRGAPPVPSRFSLGSTERGHVPVLRPDSHNPTGKVSRVDGQQHFEARRWALLGMGCSRLLGCGSSSPLTFKGKHLVLGDRPRFS